MSIINKINLMQNSQNRENDAINGEQGSALTHDAIDNVSPAFMASSHPIGSGVQAI